MHSGPLKPNLLIISITFYIFIIASLTFSAQYGNFRESSGDLAVHNQCFFNAINGKGFINTFEGGHHFGIHFSPIFFLFLPFYYLFPSPYTLQILNILFFSLSILFLFAILRDIISENASIFFLTIFYIHPAVYNIPLNSFRPEALFIFFFLGCFYFYRKKNFLPFFLFLVLSNSLRETAIFTTAIFSLIALKERRGKLWTITPVFLSLLWGIIAFGLIIPYYSNKSTVGFSHHVAGHYDYLKDVFKGGFNIKILSENIFFMRKLSFLMKLLVPLGIITPFFNIVWIFSIPDLIGVTFSKLARVASASLSCAVIPYAAFLLSSAISITKFRIFENAQLQKILKKSRLFFIALFFIFPLYHYFIASSNIMVIINTNEIIKIEKTDIPVSTFKTIINLIPENASVSAPARIANHISNRDTIYLDVNFNAEYIAGNEKFLKDTDTILLSKYFKPIFSENGWTLYKKIK